MTRQCRAVIKMQAEGTLQADYQYPCPCANFDMETVVVPLKKARVKKEPA